jgi:hypothetical protein
MEITLVNTKNGETVTGVLISETQAGWIVDVENKFGRTVRWFMLVISGWTYQLSAKEMQADEEYAG